MLTQQDKDQYVNALIINNISKFEKGARTTLEQKDNK
jgi:hypothetical protein